VSGLSEGEHASATGVDLELVQALIALDNNSFVLFMTAPTTPDHATSAKLQAALVRGGQISRLRLPDLCTGQNDVVASRLSDHEVLLNASANSPGCTSPVHRWIRIDTAKNTFTTVGSGEGFAAVAGDQLLTATTPRAPGSATIVGWQDLPVHP
jgi:hypothetical protein